MRFLFRLGSALAATVFFLSPSWSEESYTSPSIYAGSNFGQGFSTDILSIAEAIPVSGFRDGAYWFNVEREGAYHFDAVRTTYPDLLGEDASLIFMVNVGHPDYDDGNTPYSEEAVAAFAAYAAAAVQRFPVIDAVEIGNEWNSANFYRGPGWEAPFPVRAASYTRLIKATRAAVQAVRPEVRILAGAGHSISLTWFDELFESGAGAEMDEIVTHPYDVPPEMMTRKFALLRALPNAPDLPLSITEIGTTDPEEAPDYLLRSYCQLALANTKRYVWYPLNDRGDGLVPLIAADGKVTAAGEAYSLVARELADRQVVDVSPDPFTYGCRFGPDRLVLWGAERTLELLDDDLSVLDSTGAEAQELVLSPTRPLLIFGNGDETLELGRHYALGEQQVIADSYHQFSFDQPAQKGWQYWVRSEGLESPMEMRPGQQVSGVPWDPYLGTIHDGSAWADAEWVLPSRPAAGPIDIVLKHVVEAPADAVLQVDAEPRGNGPDFPILTIVHNGAILAREPVESRKTLTLEPINISSGETLEVIVSPTPSGKGSGVKLHVQLRHRETGSR